MDPNLVQNTKNQMDAKKQSQQSWFKSNYVNRTSYRKRKVLKLEQPKQDQTIKFKKKK
jgi:hypothetical protein